MINYVDRMADALVDVLKYSNSEVEWPKTSDLRPNDGVRPEWLYPAIESSDYSEITSILQYTQQEAVFDEIGELLLGIALVEMKHYAGVRDAIVALGGKLPQPFSSKNVKIGTSPVEALTLAIESEIATIEFYKSVEVKLSQDTDSVIIMKQLLKKLIADESLHLKLLNKYLKGLLNDEQKYNSIIGKWLPKIKLYIE